MVRKFEGIETSSEVSGLRTREDLRSLPQKIRDWWLTPDGQSNTFLAFIGIGVVFLWAPLAAEFVLLTVLIFSRMQLRYKKKKWDFPLRVPIIADLMDGSTNDKGKGLMFVGSEVGSRMPAYISDNDARTHALLFGTTGSGKAQPLDARVHTPTGWKLMGQIGVGDYVTAHDNTPAKVLGVFPQGAIDIYRVTFEDGRSTEACAEHLWEIHHKHWHGKYKPGVSRAGKAQPRVLNTLQLAEQIRRNSGKFSVPLPDPVEKPHADLPLHPYLLGVLIGDGNMNKYLRVSTADEEIVEAVNATLPSTMELRQYESDGDYDYWVCTKREHSVTGRNPDGSYVRNPVKVILDQLGLMGCTSIDKFVPALYKEASLQQRRLLLQGLMDTDGYAGSTCTSVSFTTISRQLALDVQEIVWSLGGIASISTKRPTYTYKGEKREGQLAYTVNIRHPQPSSLFTLERKRKNLENYQYADSLKLGVAKIEKMGVKEAQCIYIDHPRHLYISDNYIVTHNTELLLAFVVNSLVYDGGASYTDGKGDVKLWLKFLNACRMFGREDDLLLISFITSGHEFYDRQETKISNTMNPYANGSSGMCTEASISLMDSSGGGGDMWKGRAIAFLGALIKPLVFLRDKGDILLDAELIREYFDLPVLERFVWDMQDTWKGGAQRETGYFAAKYGKVWKSVIRPLEAFMVTIPGYDKGRLGKQEQKTLEQHGYITMQLARLFGDLADNYGHIMRTPLGEVDMYDVVINDRILVTLLPALERSPESLGMLGKIIVGGIKQMAAGCLGNKVEGLRREIVDARPTNSPVPFPTIFDEYGYYAVLGFSSMPAQARSLGFMVVFAAQDFASLKKSSPEEADQTWENTNLRGIGRITSGAAAETYKRMEELGGTVQVAELGGYERQFTMFGTKIRASEQVRIERKPRVNSDDLHSQANGEFHLFLGKKEQGEERGRVKVVRVNAFYTDVKPVGKDSRTQPSVATLAINHFARVAPPAEVVDYSSHVMLRSDTGVRRAIVDGGIEHTIKTNESRNVLMPMAAAFLDGNAQLGADAFATMDAAFAFMAFASLHDEQRKRELNAHLEASKLPAAFSLDKSKQSEGGKDGGSASAGASGGAAPVLTPAPVVSVAVGAPSNVGRPQFPIQTPASAPAQSAPVAAPAPASPENKPSDVVQLTEADKANLAKISLFTDGAVSIPVNSATEADLLALAKDMLAAGHAVFGENAEVPVEVVAEVAAVEGELKAKVKGLDKEAITDVIMAVEPRALGPEESAKARAEGRAFVEKMALGSSYLEVPVPTNSVTIASFQDAVNSLAEAVMRRDDKPSS